MNISTPSFLPGRTPDGRDWIVRIFNDDSSVVLGTAEGASPEEATQNARRFVAVEGLEAFLRDEIRQLREWVEYSRRGGWSTHLNEPMLRRADDIRRLLIP